MSDILQTVEKDVAGLFTFGKSHLILTLCLVVAIFAGIYLYDSRKAAVADARYETALVLGKQADANNILFQASALKQIDSLTQQNINMQMQYNEILKQMASRDAALAKQQQLVTTMSPTRLSSTWQDLIQIPNSVVPQTNGTYAVTQPGAVATVQALESVNTLKQDKVDLQKGNALLTTEVANSDKALGLEKGAHAADNATCVTDKQTLSAQVDKVKADAKKTRNKAAIFGAIFGFLVKAIIFK
jgi:hypothetical protein